MLAELPPEFWDVPYAAARFPGSPDVLARPDIAHGGNCQLFAYAVLEYFGLRPPHLRSSELWADTEATVVVSAARPLDLMFFNATADAWGAHIGVWGGADRVVHLTAELGRPAVWRIGDFATRRRYQTVVGVKRVLRRD